MMRRHTIVPVAILGAFLAVFAQFYFAVAGPPCTPPNCPGAIAVDTSNNNVTIGSSTVVNAKLGVVASSADANFYALKVNNANGGSGPILWIRNDSKVSVATTSFSTTSTLRVAGYIESTSGGYLFPDGTVQTTAGGGTSISAANVTAGTFGSAGVGGNYAFPAKLSVGTSTVGTGDLYVVGNVGIGKTTPVSKLDVGGGSANWSEVTPGLTTGSIHLDPESATDHFGSAITWGASDTGNGENAQAGIYVRSDSTYGTKMYFATTDAYVSGSKTRMFIDANGNVGIGTSTPTTKLDIRGRLTVSSAGVPDNAYNGDLVITKPSASGQYINLIRQSSYPWSIGTVYNSNTFAIGTATQTDSSFTSPYFSITTAGSVGIGTSTPQALLSVGTATTSLVGIFGGGSGKIDAGTIDPIYTIDGERYATYLPGMTGVKEETIGLVTIGSNGEYVIDFAGAPKGSDIWLFAKTTDLKNHMNEMAVSLTPGFDGRVWYDKDTAHLRLVIRGTGAGEVSYRLTAPRFDAANWPNRSDGTSPGFILNE